MERKKNRESGVVTIEATISLTAFMFAIVTILTIVNICIVQTRIGIAIHGVAKELSHYSYLYALTGLNESEQHLSEAAQGTKDDIDGVIGNVNNVFTEIQKLADGGAQVLEDAKAGALTQEGVDETLAEFESSYASMGEYGGAIKDTLTEFAKDPKKVAFGIAKIAASDGLNLAKSRLIAAPLAKALCQKNLVSEEGGDVDAYLKSLGILPKGDPSVEGAYLNGLDFSKSSLFPDGSNEIRINVSYDVKVITLLPIDFTFHFNQTAVTHGWLAGENSYRTIQDVLETVANENIWNYGTTHERSDLIRHQGIEEMKGEGYEKTKGLTDVPLYNSEKNEFMAIYSMNPLYSPEGEGTKTLNDINKNVIKEQIEYICGSIKSTTDGRKTIQTKDAANQKKEYDCTNASNKIILVIPEDEGLKEYIQAVIDEAECRGVTIELQTGYGKGARTSEVEKTEEEGGSEGE